MEESDDPNEQNQDPNVRKAKERAEKKKKEQQTNAPGKPGAGPPGSLGAPGAPKGGVDMSDIKLDVKEEGKAGPGTRGPTNNRRAPDGDDSDEEETFDGYEDDGKPFFTRIVNRFPKTITFYFMVMALAAARAATPFGVVCAYFSLIGRIVQIVGAFVEKPIIGYVGYGISCGFIVLLYFVTMIHDSD